MNLTKKLTSADVEKMMGTSLDPATKAMIDRMNAGGPSPAEVVLSKIRSMPQAEQGALTNHLAARIKAKK